jgi:hypothetical protein
MAANVTLLDWPARATMNALTRSAGKPAAAHWYSAAVTGHAILLTAHY